MKNVILLIAILFAAGLSNSIAQGTWTQKADFGGGARSKAAGFSMGNKGYIGTGYVNGSGDSKDFWEYDVTTNLWIQKANVGGAGRANAAGFSIGSKGYFGAGYNGSYTKEFWAYDSATNAWSQKTSFGGTARQYQVGFSIGSKGYIGTGYDGLPNYKKDFWEYDPSTNAWTQKADFGGTARALAVGFSIGSKGYIGTGEGLSGFKKDFWEYDPSTNMWSQKADFGGTARSWAVGFSIGDNGYIGTGQDPGSKNDFWEYNPSTNTWTQKADFGGPARFMSVGFSIGSKGYIGTGINAAGTYYKDFWEYTPDDAECEVPTNLSSIILTSSKVYLNWDEVAGAEKYKLRYRVTGTNEWTIKNPVAHSKTITGLLPNTDYEWQVKTYCQVASPRVTSAWSDKHYFTTDPLRLGTETINPSINVYPNPFSNSATISFSVPQAIHATIELYDLAGRKLQTVLNENTAAGNHELNLNRDQLNAGIYFLRLRVDGNEVIKKLIIQ